MSWLHVQHCTILITHICLYQYAIHYYKTYCESQTAFESASSGYIYYLYLLFLPMNIIITVGRAAFSAVEFLGLVLYDCCPDNLNAEYPEFPFSISFRTITRGDYGQLIKDNIEKNKNVCARVGLKKYIFEIATEKPIDGIQQHEGKVEQIVIPPNYQTKRGTLFKARNLQYCLEDGISSLRDEDWIVHLDEDSILTVEAVKGIIKFIREGKHKIGQGPVTFDPDNQLSFTVKFLLALRVALDYGMNRFMGNNFSARNAFIKGSFVVCNVRTEKEVSFDGGLDSSILDFIWFALKANSMGIGVGPIEGNILELGSLTVSQYISQFTRVLFGLRKMFINNVQSIVSNFFAVAYYLYWLSFIAYNVTFFCNFLVYVKHISYPLLFFQGLVMAHDTYVGFFDVLLKRKRLTLSLILIYIAHNIIGLLYTSFVVGIAIVQSTLQKEIKFVVTKKTN